MVPRCLWFWSKAVMIDDDNTMGKESTPSSFGMKLVDSRTFFLQQKMLKGHTRTTVSENKDKLANG